MAVDLQDNVALRKYLIGIRQYLDAHLTIGLVGKLGRSNVILTPHVAFYSDASMLDNRKISSANVRNFLDGNDVDVRRFIL